MKKRILLAVSMVMMLVCVLAISAGAASTTGVIDYAETATLTDGTVLPIYDEDKNPLIWYISGTETVTVDGVETTKNIYSSVVSTATKESPDANGYYVIYNGSTKTYTGPTGEQLPYFYSTEIWIKHTTDTSVNFKGDDTMVVANLRGVNIGDFQGGTIDKLQCFYAPVNMVRSGDFRVSSLVLADFTQSVNMRMVISQAFSAGVAGKIKEVRFPTIEPIYNAEGVLVNAFEIGNYGFQNCKLITKLDFPETLYKVGNNAFQNCNNMTTIGSVPNLTIINADAFENCYTLTGLDFKNTKLTTIGARAFRYAGVQDFVEFPSTLTSIGENAFYQAKLIKAVKLSENLESLGNQAFRQITTLEYFDFNGFEIETMGDYFFYQNRSLKAVSLPEGLTSFGTRCFEGCTSLEALYLPDSVTMLPYLQSIKNLYFVNEPFAIDWESGIFASADWNGQKPEKPEIYYMPTSLVSVQEKSLHSCTGINDTIVFPEGFTQVADQYTFFSIANRNFVFLGNVTLFNTNSTGLSNYYFINDSVTDESLTGTRADKYQLYFHSAGAHLTEKRNTVADADCVTDEKAANICFCGHEISIDYVPDTALGHNHTVALGIIYEDYFANGYIGFGCERCDDVNKTEAVDPIFSWKGYSCTETAIGGANSITQAYAINRDALDAYKAEKGEAFSFGMVAAVNYTDNSVEVDFSDEKVQKFDLSDLIHDWVEIKVAGLSGEQLNVNIVFCAYVSDNGKTIYLDEGATKTALTGFSYNAIYEKLK